MNIDGQREPEREYDSESEGFPMVIEVVVKETMPVDISESLEMVIEIGLKTMIADILPNDEVLLSTIISMFQANPEFVSEFISRTLQNGENETLEKAKEYWNLYR